MGCPRPRRTPTPGATSSRGARAACSWRARTRPLSPGRAGRRTSPAPSSSRTTEPVEVEGRDISKAIRTATACATADLWHHGARNCSAVRCVTRAGARPCATSWSWASWTRRRWTDTGLTFAQFTASRRRRGTFLRAAVAADLNRGLADADHLAWLGSLATSRCPRPAHRSTS